MNKNKQRIVIAEACGYKDLETQWSNYHQWECPDGRIRFGTLNDKYACLPDYLNDLNAIYEAEKILSNSQVWKMDSVLFNMADCVAPFRATASQRAEAFLRTLNLWEE